MDYLVGGERELEGVGSEESCEFGEDGELSEGLDDGVGVWFGGFAVAETVVAEG